MIFSNITYLYLALLACVGVAMKACSVLTLKEIPASNKLKFFLLGPTPDYSTLLKGRMFSKNDVWDLIKVILPQALLLVIIYSFKEKIFFSNNWIINSYVAIIPFFILTNCFGRILQLLSLKDWSYLPAVHQDIFKSTSLKQFWGKRWNTFFSDWFREHIFSRFSNPALGSFASFFISAFIHEIIVNVPLYLIYQKSLFGSMFLYFFIQFIGSFIETRLLKNTSLNFKTIFCWIVIILPAPLVLNLGTLRLFMFLPH